MIQATYESIAESIIHFLKISSSHGERLDLAVPWDSFIKLSNLIHENYVIPSTTFTPMMRRLLFALGIAAKPSTIVGIGTFVGYTFSWLLRDRSDTSIVKLTNALGIDIDSEANVIARKNCWTLGHQDRLSFRDEDGIHAMRSINFPIDLLYLDLDSPVEGKRGYADIVKESMPHLLPGSMIVAHDACVPKFRTDFINYHGYLQGMGVFEGPWTFPVDACGLSITIRR